MHVADIALVVREHEEAIEFYCRKLGFSVAEDSVTPAKRWVRLRAPGGEGAGIVLSRAGGEAQLEAVGNQAGGRVFLYMSTASFDSEYARLVKLGITFTEPPRHEAYGKVAVFQDLYGNRIDLIERSGP